MISVLRHTREYFTCETVATMHSDGRKVDRVGGGEPRTSASCRKTLPRRTATGGEARITNIPTALVKDYLAIGWR